METKIVREYLEKRIKESQNTVHSLYKLISLFDSTDNPEKVDKTGADLCISAYSTLVEISTLFEVYSKFWGSSNLQVLGDQIRKKTTRIEDSLIHGLIK